ncbi:hypothetical protein V1281_004223 [Nitrobacteraceae bacterium AZCC 2161]
MKARGQVFAEIEAGVPSTVISGADFLIYLGEEPALFLISSQLGLPVETLRARIADVSVAMEIEILDVPPPLPPVAPALPGFRVKQARDDVRGAGVRKTYIASVETKMARIRKLRLNRMKKTMSASLTDYLALYQTPATVAAATTRLARHAGTTPALLVKHGTEVVIQFSTFNTDGNWFSADISAVVRSKKVNAK